MMMVTRVPIRKREGIHVFSIAPQLTYFPLNNIRKQSVTMFHLLLWSYSMVLRALATWLWQLSQQRLCMR